MKKKTIAGLCVISGLLFISSVTFADELKEALELYLQDPSFDLCGREFDKILFDSINSVLVNGYTDAEIIAKLKAIPDDFKTLPLQIKCTDKILEQNLLIYAPLAGLGGLNKAIGAEKFSKLMLKVLRVIFK